MSEFEDHVNAAILGAFDYPWLGDDQRRWISSRFGNDVVEAVAGILEFAESHRDMDPAFGFGEIWSRG